MLGKISPVIGSVSSNVLKDLLSLLETLIILNIPNGVGPRGSELTSSSQFSVCTGVNLPLPILLLSRGD